MDRLEVELACQQEVRVLELLVALERRVQRDPYRVLDEARLQVCVLDDEELVRPFQQLVDRRAHRALDDRGQVLGVDRMLAADVERPAAALVVGRDRDKLEDAFHVDVVEARLEQPLRGATAHEALRTRAGVDPGRLDAHDPAHARLRGRRDPDQRDHLLRREPCDRSPPRQRVARRDPHLCAACRLPGDDVPRDVLGELLDEEGLLDHDLVDRLLEQLGEAGHVDALLLRIQIDRAVDLRGDELLRPAPPQADRLFDALHPGPGQAELHLGRRGLYVVEQLTRLRHADRLVSPGSVAAADSSFPRLVSLAAHDLRTPLATIHGFAQTLLRMGDLGEPKQKYMEMIDTASRQLAELLDELGTAARIEGGRYEPSLQPVDTLELARAAADQLGEERVRVTGEGGEVHVDPEAIERGVSALAQAALRHGGLEEVGLQVDGATLTISPVTAASAPVVLGEELRDLGAAVAVRVVRALGGAVEVEGDALTVRLPQ